IEKEVRIFAQRQDADAARVVQILVQRARDPRVRETIHEERRVRTSAERHELHEQPAIGSLRLAVLHPAFLAEIGRFGAATRFSGHIPNYTQRNMPYPVREATLDDLDVLVHHRIAMFTDMGRTFDSGALAAAYVPWLREHLPPGTYRSWLAIAEDGSVAGGAGATIIPWPPGPSYPVEKLAFVYNVYTEPSHRRQGGARLRMDGLPPRCRAPAVLSIAPNARRDGQPLYEAMGYEVTPPPMLFFSLVGV